MKSVGWRWLVLAAIALATGCASVPYPYGKGLEGPRSLRLQPDESQIARGRPHKFLDAAGWIWIDSLAAKLILWNTKIDSHRISEDTEAAVRTYLEKNDLRNVKVRLNEYDVKGEWKRLIRNRDMNPFWRYTLGVISVSMYTIMPGRWFGGDNYNPYTNTINIYSDHPAVALHEAGHAKDFASRRFKGVYAAIYAIPFVSLYHEAKATGDALGYMKAEEQARREKDAYKVLYPAYATYIAANVADVLPAPYRYPLYAAAVIPAHIVGRIKAVFVPAEADAAAPAAPIETDTSRDTVQPEE